MQTENVELANVEAEQAVLGSILLDGDMLQECTLQPHHFSHAAHQQIYKAMQDVDADGNRIDVVTVTTKLGEAIGQVGGVDYLGRLADSIPSLASFPSHQRLVYEGYRLKEAHRLASGFVVAPDQEKIEEMYRRLDELQEIGVSSSEPTKRDVLIDIHESIYEDRGEMTGIDTGYYDLNDMTGGLQDGDLIVVAARPSMGKTALALNLAMNACYKGTVADVFSLEMPEKQITQRMLSAIGRIHASKWRNPYRRFNDEDREKASRAMGIYEKMDLYAHDQSRMTTADIRAIARKTHKQHPDQQHLIVVDYLQEISADRRYENRNIEISQMVHDLKGIARSLNVPLVLLSQLSRGVENRQDKRPVMSDLRDSGAIEQSADMVVFLYRDDYYNRDQEASNIVELNVAKHRNGPIGVVELGFSREYQRFLNLDRKREG